MLRWLLPLALLSSVAFAQGGGDDQPDVFVAAYLAGDDDEFVRLAEVAGPAELRGRLAHEHRLQQLSAIAVARFSADPARLLAALAIACDAPDRAVASAAARAGLHLISNLDAGAVETRGIAKATLAAALPDWRRIVNDEGRWADVRVHALEVSDQLARASGASDDLAFVLTQLAATEPELRRAALELLPQPLNAKTRAAAIIAVHDKAPMVAATAGGVLCQAISTGDNAAPIMAALGAKGKAALAAIHQTSASWLEPAVKRHIAACLRPGDAH